MANLTASGSNPSVTLDDTDAGADDWRFISGSGDLKIQEDPGSTGSWEERVLLQSVLATFYTDVTISEASPTLTLEDTTASAYDFRMRVDGNAFFLERYNNTAWAAVFQADSSYVYANNGIGAGSTDSAQTIQWRRGSGNLDVAASTTITFTGTKQKILVALVACSESAANNLYSLGMYDYRDEASAGHGFYVFVNFGDATTDDSITINYDAACQGGNYKYVVFFTP